MCRGERDPSGGAVASACRAPLATARSRHGCPASMAPATALGEEAEDLLPQAARSAGRWPHLDCWESFGPRKGTPAGYAGPPPPSNACGAPLARAAGFWSARRGLRKRAKLQSSDCSVSNACYAVKRPVDLPYHPGQAPTTPPAAQAPLLGQGGERAFLPSFSRRGGAKRRGGSRKDSTTPPTAWAPLTWGGGASSFNYCTTASNTAPLSAPVIQPFAQRRPRRCPSCRGLSHHDPNAPADQRRAGGDA